MEKDKLDMIIVESLKEEVKEMKMSSSLRESIRKRTIDDKNLYKRFKELMNTTIEIPVPSAIAVCILLCLFTFSTFSATENMKKDKSIRGYTSVRIMKMGNIDVIVDRENGGQINDKEDKN